MKVMGVHDFRFISACLSPVLHRHTYHFDCHCVGLSGWFSLTTTLAFAFLAFSLWGFLEKVEFFRIFIGHNKLFLAPSYIHSVQVGLFSFLLLFSFLVTGSIFSNWKNHEGVYEMAILGGDFYFFIFRGDMKSPISWNDGGGLRISSFGGWETDRNLY